MSDLKLYLPTKEEEESPQIYVNQKLVPLAAELHRLVNENMTRGVTEENSDIDMVPQEVGKQYSLVNMYLHTVRAKFCTFSVDTKQTPLQKDGKMLKVMYKATVYSENGKPVHFRLMRVKDKVTIRQSDIQTANTKPTEHVLYLPLGDSSQKDRIQIKENEYCIEAKYVQLWARPICRRFSLSLVYV